MSDCDPSIEDCPEIAEDADTSEEVPETLEDLVAKYDAAAPMWIIMAIFNFIAPWGYYFLWGYFMIGTADVMLIIESVMSLIPMLSGGLTVPDTSGMTAAEGIAAATAALAAAEKLKTTFETVMATLNTFIAKFTWQIPAGCFLYSWIEVSSSFWMMAYWADSSAEMQRIGASYRTMQAEFWTRWILGALPVGLFVYDIVTKTDRVGDAVTYGYVLLAISGGLWLISVVGYTILYESLSTGYNAIVLRDALERVAVNEGEKCFYEGTDWEDPECMARVAGNKANQASAEQEEEFENFGPDEW